MTDHAVKIPGQKEKFSFNKFRSGLIPLLSAIVNRFFQFLENIKSTGFSDSMDEYEKRKLGIFNLLNLFQYCTGLLVPVILIINEPGIAWFSDLVIIIPPLISIAVLYLNSKKKFDAALVTYFILYPFFSSLVYLNGINLGTELFFILYGILSVFFLKELSHIIFCIGFSMVNYFILAVVLSTYNYNLEYTSRFLYLLNQLLAIGFIFYGLYLYLVKKENSDYQQGILRTNEMLERLNLEIQNQKEVITEKARLLEEQATQLKAMDNFKTRLFSIVSHDLKNPLYALRNLFSEIQQKQIPEKEIIKLIPQVIKDLNYTTGLTDNLLHWARSQMQASSMFPQELNVSALIEEVYQQQRLQAEIKGVNVLLQLKEPIVIYADRDMISLVIRNLLSNAIKFTPEGANVTIGVNELDTSVEIFISDQGEGLSSDALERIRRNDYFTTRGTANEPGTGLGLMLVKEFLVKNKGYLHIESTIGQGSTFSFTLPKPQES
jgi:signal transduction histidine kinase